MKTIRVKDQITQTTPSLTTRPPFGNIVEHSTPIGTPEQPKDFYKDHSLTKSSNLILEPSKTPINFEESSSPHFKLSVDETPKNQVKPKSRAKMTARGPSQDKTSRKRLKLSSTESADINMSPSDSHLEKLSGEFSKQVSQKYDKNKKHEKSNFVDEDESDQVLVADAGTDSFKSEPVKKRGRPKKNPNKESTKAATVPSKNNSKKEPKIPKSEPMVSRKTMAKQDETPVTTKKSSINVSKIKVVHENAEETAESPKTPRSPNNRRQKLHKQRENLMKKIERVEHELESYHNPDPNLRRSLRIREKMIQNLQSEIAMLMNLVHFVERQDEILMRQQRKFKEKTDTLIKRPVGRRPKKLRIVSDEDFSSS